MLEILQLLCSTFATFTAHVLVDLLPGGTFHSPDESLLAEGKSVQSTNAVSERDFAQFDSLLREKPNASILAIEGMIVFANNQTGKWVASKTDEERGCILASA